MFHEENILQEMKIDEEELDLCNFLNFFTNSLKISRDKQSQQKIS